MGIVTRYLLPGLALGSLAAARPLDSQNGPNKRADLTVYADVAVPTDTVNEVIFEDKGGNAMTTATMTVEVLPTAGGVSLPSVLPTVTAKAGADIAASAFAASPNSASKGSTSSTSSSGTSSSGADLAFPPSKELNGVAYSPYTADGGCKSSSDVGSDFQRLKGDYSMVRLYGTDCNQVASAYAAAKDIGVKLFLGVYQLGDMDSELDDIISGVNKDWSMVDTVSIGNELVNDGQASASDVTNAVNSARSKLRSAGYQGPVVTVDTFNAVEANPELCDASDYCAFNAHPFFDSSTSAEQAGSWLANTVNAVKSSVSSSKKFVVTETGWPTQGMNNGNAVPSLENQHAALSSIKSAFQSNPGDVIFLSAFNDLWKQAQPSTFDAEQYWGINGATSSSG